MADDTIKYMLQLNIKDGFNSIVTIDGERFTIMQLITLYEHAEYILKQTDEAVYELRKRFRDYYHETEGEDDPLILLDAIVRGATKQRDDWKPSENAQAEIDEYEAHIKEMTDS